MKKIEDITFHYTNEKMAIDLINYLNLDYDNSICDAGSGKNKVWYKNINVREKYECELEDGNDFLLFDKKVNWVIGNPPFHLSWKFTEKAVECATDGFAWLINNQALNSHNTPKRIEYLNSKGFYLQKMRVVADKRWFGRYYFVVYTKEKNDFLTFDRLTHIVFINMKIIKTICVSLSLLMFGNAFAENTQEQKITCVMYTGEVYYVTTTDDKTIPLPCIKI